MDLGLAGKSALVMAATKGLGRAIAEALAREGAQIVLSSSNQDRCDQVAREIASSTGAECYGFEADMFEPTKMDQLVSRAREVVGSIDILIINHVGPALGSAKSVDSEILDAHYRLMVSSPIRLIARVLPEMREQHWGRILSVGGISMIQALPNKIMDNIFRPAILNYTKALANEVAADSVTVNVIVPGTFVTDRVQDSTAKNAQLWGMSFEHAMQKRLQRIPAGRFGELEELGAVAAFVCSNQAAYVNGSIIRVDGGQTKAIS